MPEYPGVYVEEIPAGRPIIQGASTHVTGFIGRALDGPINEPIQLISFSEYEKEFGGLWSESPMSYAVQHFFQNGGMKAVIVRVNGEERDNGRIGFAEIADPNLQDKQCGIWAFEKTEMVNLMCIPPFGWNIDVDVSTWKAALNYCKNRRAFLIVDPSTDWKNVEDAVSGIEIMNIRDSNGAIYFPRIRIADPKNNAQLKDFAPCGAVAGVIAHTDVTRGVWKAPAGPGTSLAGVLELSIPLNNQDMRQLSSHGINCLLNKSGATPVIWGARTLHGDDRSDSDWKYVNTRRLFLFIQKSLDQGLKWVEFETNDEHLWSQIRFAIGEFLHKLWRQGALLGSTPQEAYFVKCGWDTMTQGDIDLGSIIILIGFALNRPAEFVIINRTYAKQV